ncbi:eukaryotic peptide chain release factor subunit 2 [Hokovirus HKV1]|uniref:Eukaryotic peptide chain release factor subunit 2 n=1 Tax=Hokovirus HKV1 TaxID=1977638 RepID=A0A1V0SH78_9VIRU|nr:eukaryotic peptide chain release factor subunit 2 [Hokovirus HKV1]
MKMALCYAQELLSQTCLVFSLIKEDNCIILEPPKKLQNSNYICDKRWHLDLILEMYEEKKIIGIALLSGSLIKIYNIIKTGNHYEINNIKNVEIELQKKQRKGGSSSARIGRKREGRELHCVKETTELLVKHYMTDNNTKCICENALIIAGPAEFKHKVMEQPLFIQYLKKHVIMVHDLDINNDNVINEIINMDKNILEFDEKLNSKCIDDIKNYMALNPDILAFGTEIKDLAKLCQLSKIYFDFTKYDKYRDYKNKYDYGIEIYCCNLLNEIGIDEIGIKWFNY